MAEDYKYDVAFSFLSKDENIALQLQEILKDRIKTFVYGTRQREMAGKDGEILLNRTYGKESRIVVILYREGWGKSGWTAIEERAIRDRGFENHNYNFLLFVSLNQKVEKPEWLPKSLFGLDYSKYGLEVTASTIELRVQEFGGEIKVETTMDRLRKLKEQQIHEDKRREVLASSIGMQYLAKEYAVLLDQLKEKVIELKNIGWLVKEEENKQNGINIFLQGYSLLLQYSWNGNENSTEGVSITISVWNSYIDVKGQSRSYNPSKIAICEYAFTINEFDQKGWLTKSRTRIKEFHLTEALVEFWIEKFVVIVNNKTKPTLSLSDVARYLH